MQNGLYGGGRYRWEEDGESHIEYRKNVDGDLFEIDFWEEDNTVSKNYYRNMGYITMQELQAINEKVKELGWYEKM